MEDLEPGPVSGTPLAVVGQPIFALDDGRIAGYEALSRFPALPDQTPDGVFRLAAEQGVGLELEEEAIRQAVSHLIQITSRNAFLTVNASPAAAAASAIQEVVARSAPEAIVLEITDQGQVDSYTELKRALAELRLNGLRVAITTSGAVSPAGDYMSDLRPDMIKLDGAWTVQVNSDPVRRSMVRSLIEFGRDIHALVVAGQVETSGQFAAMRDLGVDLVQGYFLCRPEPFDSLFRRSRLF